MGQPADPWRARRARHQGGTVDGVADPQGRRDRPGSPQGRPGWAEFLRSQAQGILALDFFTADLLNGTKAYILAVIEHGSRRVRVLGATGHPVQSWVVQQARNLDRTLIWNQRHLMLVLREYEDFYNSHRPHRALGQAAPLRPLADRVTDLDHFRVQRHDRAGGVIHEYRLVA